jgi:hypothetical protein
VELRPAGRRGNTPTSYPVLTFKNARRMAGESPGLSAVAGRLLPEYGRGPSAWRRLSSAGARARSRRSSSMRARIAGKSSAAWDRITFAPLCSCRALVAAREIGKL